MQLWEFTVAITLCVSVALADQCTAPTEITTVNHRMASIIALDVNTGHVKVIQQCAQMCLLFTACKAFGFRRMPSECELYRANKLTNPSDVVTDGKWTYSDISEWPESIAGRCHDHTCLDDEMCTSFGTTWKCVKLKAQCDDGWVKTSNNCYKIVPHVDVTFAEAVEACKQENALLTDIESEDEQNTITELLQSQVPNIWPALAPSLKALRIGGTDRAIEDTWVWESRGNAPFQTLAWAPDEPNNFNGDQDCAIIVISPASKIGNLGDQPCVPDAALIGYICKKGHTLYL